MKPGKYLAIYFCRLIMAYVSLVALTPIQASATEETFLGGLQRRQIVLNASFEVSDTFPTTVDQTVSVRDFLRFYIDDDTLIKSAVFTHWVDVTIEKYDINNTLIGTETNVRFTVSYSPLEGAAYKNAYIYEFKDVHRMKVTVTNLSSGFPVYMRLEGKIMINRKYPFSCTTPPVLYQKTAAQLVNTNINALQVGWQKMAGAEEYDLEWSFYDTLSPTITLASGTSNDFGFIFSNNATRITTGQTWYNIPLTYPKGRIYWRLRGVRYKNGKRETGAWTSLRTTPDNLVVRKEWYYVNPHEQTLNWQMQMTFAEEGKKSQTANYLDGSLRPRQTVVRSDAIDMTVASEIIYDSLGRSAVQIMPAPVSFGTGANDWTRMIKYNSTYTTAPTKNSYSSADFSFNSQVCGNAGINPASIVDTLNSAVGRYFSFNNPHKDRFMTKFTPNSQGYPFAVTEYMPDGTGRVRRQGGVGQALQLGSSHETKYLYSKPDQNELDRLFGNEAGLASHYQKNAVIDPNGQMNVSYIDAHGRTVATALAGTIDTNVVRQLSNFNAATRTVENLLSNTPADKSLVSTYSLLVTNAGAKDTIIYILSPNLDLSLDSCLAAPRCYDCKYDLEIKVTGECGDVLLSNSWTNFDANDLNAACGQMTDTIFRLLEINPGLPVGQYQVTKTLKISEQALQYYIDDYLKNLTCLPTITNLQNTLLDDTTCNETCQECLTNLGSKEDFRTKYLQGVPSPTAEDIANADEIYAQAKLDCEALCDESDVNGCENMYRMMLQDVSPGGQYAAYSTIDLGTDEEITFGPSTDKSSVFYLAPGETRYPYQRVVELENNTERYRNEKGEIDYVEFPDSTRVRIDSLGINEFITFFKPSWAKTLVKAHPEYCLYLCCTRMGSSAWDSAFASITTYSDAVANGYLPIENSINNDPFFLDDPLLLDSMLTTWQAYTQTAESECSSPLSLTEILISMVFCGGTIPCNVTPGGACTADNNYYWQVVQSHYISEKERLKANKMRGGSCPPVDPPDPPNEFCKNYNQLCFGKATCNGQPNPYQNKTARIQFTPAPLTGEAAEDSLYSLLDTVQYHLGAACDTTCAAMAEQWILKLQETCPTIAGANTTDIDDLRDRFIAVCLNGCDMMHPFGAVSTNGTPTDDGDLTLQDAITGVFPGLTGCDVNCSAELIDFPGTYSTPKYMAPSEQILLFDSCRCARIDALDDCWNLLGHPNLLSYINSTSNVTLTQAELDELTNGCTSECHFMAQPVTIPPILECGACKTLTEVKAEFNTYYAGCGDTSSIEHKRLMAAHLNQKFGLNRTFTDYSAFVVGDSTHPNCRYICPLNLYEEFEVDTSCVSLELEESTLAMANLQYQNLLDSIKTVFIRKYLDKCLGSELKEKFEARLSQGEYHYTLYYYDQADNLVRTVPPSGVTPLTSTADLNAVKNHRINPLLYPAKYPNHNFNTRYWYNSLDQTTRDSTPDRGVTNYWYDQLGRLILSQNAEQFAPSQFKRYNYNRYDALGRVYESGVVTRESATVPTTGYLWTYSEYEDWLLNGPVVGWNEVTKSYYDAQIADMSATLSPFFPNADGTNGQANLRNRIASVLYYETRGTDTLSYTSATHYSYDVSGNVKQMLQDIPELNVPGNFNHRFKRIGYDYDLISGKVNYVYYQKDSIDQFIHHYAYDADNRIQFVETSRDGLIWERDANYEYYLHGPLGRTELGERRVQGLDYAYTLQGWLKGMNASALSQSSPNTANFATRDMGRDGKSGNTNDFARNRNVSRDVAAFTLGYYYGDYKKLNQTTTTDNFELRVTATSGPNVSTQSLYNGNIRHAVYTIARLRILSGYPQPECYTYKYDQLNRLVRMRSMVNFTLTEPTYSWSAGNVEQIPFREDAAYDPNGNILSYYRNGAVSTQYNMDKLTYTYAANTNKLTQIDDAQTNQTAYTGDLEDQAANNYTYDLVGNLIADVRDSITAIFWTDAQKISSIQKSDRKITFRYNPMQQRLVKYSRPNGSNVSEKRTYYVRDAQGNVMATYAGFVKNNNNVITWDSIKVDEQHIYGSSRTGLQLTNVKLWPNVPKNPHLPDTSHYVIFAGRKRYEITNHLGNVLSVITDRKRGVAVSGTAIQWYDADVVAAQQYYPFGQVMPYNASTTLRRQYWLASPASPEYRYGFNGKENDDEVKGDDNQQDYGMRIYDPRAGRFLSVDPIAREYPWYSPYQFAGNMPIWAVDLDGLEPSTAAQYSISNEGLPILKSSAVDHGEPNHPTNKREIKTSEFLPSPPSPEMNVPYNERFQAAARTNAVNVLNTVVADPQALKQGDPVEWLGILPIAKGGKIIKGAYKRLDNFGNIFASYVNTVKGGEGLGLKWGAYRYLATARYVFLRPSNQLPASLGMIRLRHYTSEAGLSFIKESLTLNPGRRGLVYNIIGGDDIMWGAKEAEMYLGIGRGKATHYVEYSIDASRVQTSVHPWTNLLEYNVKGSIDLNYSNPKFFENVAEK